MGKNYHNGGSSVKSRSSEGLLASDRRKVGKIESWRGLVNLPVEFTPATTVEEHNKRRRWEKRGNRK
jgi:hypothetical protein